MASEYEWEVEFMRGLAARRREAILDEKATAAYWNGDDWGGATGHQDAADWVEEECAKWVREQIASRPTP